MYTDVGRLCFLLRHFCKGIRQNCSFYYRPTQNDFRSAAPSHARSVCVISSYVPVVCRCACIVITVFIYTHLILIVFLNCFSAIRFLSRKCWDIEVHLFSLSDCQCDAALLSDTLCTHKHCITLSRVYHQTFVDLQAWLYCKPRLWTFQL